MNCHEHGNLAQSFEIERQYYLSEIKATQQRIHRNDFNVFLAGLLAGVVLCLIIVLI